MRYSWLPRLGGLGGHEDDQITTEVESRELGVLEKFAELHPEQERQAHWYWGGTCEVLVHLCKGVFEFVYFYSEKDIGGDFFEGCVRSLC